jgi:menaquinone-dependent protoporphyrinogen oxidase
MATVLILYRPTEGQTASISEYIAEVLRDHGHEAEKLDIKELRAVSRWATTRAQSSEPRFT